MMKREQTFLSDLDWISLRLVRIFALTLQNIDKSLWNITKFWGFLLDEETEVYWLTERADANLLIFFTVAMAGLSFLFFIF